MTVGVVREWCPYTLDSVVEVDGELILNARIDMGADVLALHVGDRVVLDGRTIVGVSLAVG